jgi:hypothetical protein
VKIEYDFRIIYQNFLNFFVLSAATIDVAKLNRPESWIDKWKFEGFKRTELVLSEWNSKYEWNGTENRCFSLAAIFENSI